MEKTNDFDFDFPTWTDIKNKTSEVIGTVTNNPVMVATSQTAQKTNEALKNAGITKQVTTADIAKSSDPVKAEQQRKEISDSVTEGLKDLPSKLLGPFKWILILALIIVLIAIFVRVSGK